MTVGSETGDLNDGTLGTLSDGTTVGYRTDVTYYYKVVTGDVIINYEDAEGNTIKESVTDEDDQPVGKNYDTTDEGDKPSTIQNDDQVYYYKEVKTGSDKETGTVKETDTEVTYVYDEKGEVVVHYVGIDENGNEFQIQADATDTAIGWIHDDAGNVIGYDTTDNGMKPTTLTVGNYTYVLVTDMTVGSETGDLNDGTLGTLSDGTTVGYRTDVTYYYKVVTGDVIINYEDTQGNTLQDSVIDEDDQPVGKDYDTTDEGDKPTRITNDDQVYYYKEVKTDSDSETGKVKEADTVVTYVYDEKGEVVVHYVGINPDGSTFTIQADVTDTAITWLHNDAGNENTYDTTDNKPTTLTVNGITYELVASMTEGTESGGLSNGTLGTLSDGTTVGYLTNVTYYYKALVGDVVINYEDEDGNVIKDPVTDEDDQPTGTSYDTTDEGDKPDTIEKDGKTYYFKEVKEGSDPEQGTVESGTKTVTYVYGEKAEVVVHYVDEAGNTIAADVTDTTIGFVKDNNNAYDTTDHKPKTIVYNGKTYVLTAQQVTSDSDSETGALKDGDYTTLSDGTTVGYRTDVTYVYQLAGDVVIKYEDPDGNEIKDPVTDEDDQPTGKEYDTTDEGDKPDTIEKDDHTYYYKEVKEGSDPEKGKVEDGTKTVTYVYDEKAEVVVHYVDEDGNTIAADVTDTTIGFVKDNNNAYDTTDNKPKTIVYNGNTYVLTAQETTTDSDSETGALKDGDYTTLSDGTTVGYRTDVTYVYKLLTGDVVIKYEDPDGKEIKDPVTDEDDQPTGKDYDTTDEGDKPDTIEKDDHTYYYKEVKEGSDPETGKVKEEDTTVTYVYDEKAEVVVHYVDEDGNTIAADVTDTTIGFVKDNNNAYDTTDHKPKTIVYNGKTYVLTAQQVTSDSDSETGALKDGDYTTLSDGTTVGYRTDVTYVYQLAGDVVIKYEDPDGNEIKDPVTDEDDQPTGKEYDTTDEGDKPDTIEKDGKTYYFKEVKEGSDPEQGTVEDGTKTVTYVYELKGDVIVHYQDTEGNTIAVDVTDTPLTWVGTDYDTTDNKPTYITFNGKTYKITTKVIGNENGTVVNGTTEITYIYELVKEDVPTTPETPEDPKAPEVPVQPGTPTEGVQTGVESFVSLNVAGTLISSLGAGMLLSRKKRRK